MQNQFSASFNEEVEINYNYTAVQTFVIRYRGTVNGVSSPVVFRSTKNLSNTEGTVVGNRIATDNNVYEIFPKEYTELYLQFVLDHNALMTQENVIASNSRGFSAEMQVDFTYNINVPNWNLNETMTETTRFALSSEVYNFMSSGNAVLNYSLSTINQRELSLPIIILFIVALSLAGFALIISFSKIKVDPNVKRQELLTILKKYKDEIVISERTPLTQYHLLMPVERFDELLKLSINLNKHIVCYQDGEASEFFVLIGDYAYYYIINLLEEGKDTTSQSIESDNKTCYTSQKQKGDK